MKSIYEKKWTVILIAIFCSILWGSAFPVLKISYEELQMAPDDTVAKMVLAGMRFLLAGIIILAGLVITNPKRLLVTRRQIPVLILLGIFQTTVQYYFFYNGLANVTGMQGAILSSAGTFFVVILAHFFYKNDRMNWKKAIGLIAGFAGIIVANWGQGLELSFQLNGEGFMILSAVAAAIATIMAKELAVGIHPFTLTGWQLSIGAAVMLLIGLPQLGENAMSFTPLGWGLFIYSALLSAVAFALWYSILKYNKAGEIAIYKFITPVSGALLSAMFIPGESINLYIVGAIALVAVGIIAINSGKD
ncbi:EamA/RhaT family transporter [Oceanobacillus arenosus]|uniref:EamA/RhaT family transporter n=1 Tax=Oceanobacillus arenosus TaxID=1229153 RepID=A0A3D8PZ81_9BACI|nr:DMT family transporter [Oceanobacillus arenosus]RDW21466.1 EamA/RhaT family transporter [Oceanobacillus arenosus]